jgi:hypothetical protein
MLPNKAMLNNNKVTPTTNVVAFIGPPMRMMREMISSSITIY